MQRAWDIREQFSRFLSRRFGGNLVWIGSIRQEIDDVGSHSYKPAERIERYHTLRGKVCTVNQLFKCAATYEDIPDYIMFDETYDGKWQSWRYRCQTMQFGQWTLVEPIDT